MKWITAWQNRVMLQTEKNIQNYHGFLLFSTVVSAVDGALLTLLTLPNNSVVFLSIN